VQGKMTSAGSYGAARKASSQQGHRSSLAALRAANEERWLQPTVAGQFRPPSRAFSDPEPTCLVASVFRVDFTPVSAAKSTRSLALAWLGPSTRFKPGNLPVL